MSDRPRFSKASVAEWARLRQAIAATDFLAATGRRIDPSNGTAQTILHGDRDLVHVRGAADAYARWRSMQDIIDEVTS